MFKIAITTNVREVARVFKSVNLKKGISQAIERLAFTTEREAKKVTPVDTGRLRASIATNITPFRAIVAPHTHYAGFVHEGTRYMRARPYLKWGWETTRRTVNIEKDFERFLRAELRVKFR